MLTNLQFHKDLFTLLKKSLVGNSGLGRYAPKTCYEVEAYSEASRTFKMELFTKIVNSFLFAKCHILDVRLGSEYTSVEASEKFL